MATKWYLTNRVAPYTPATLRGGWNDSAGAVTKALDSLKVNGGESASVARAEANASNTYGVLLYRGISGPLAAQTINCNVDVVIGIRESNIAADFNWRVHLFATQGDSDSVRATLIDAYTEAAGTNEWPTTATFKALNAAQAVNQVVSAGDRLVLEVGLIARNAVTTSYTGTLYYGLLDANGYPLADGVAGGTDVTAKAGYLSFSSDVAEAALTASVAQLSTRTLSLGAPQARAAQVSVRSLSAAWASEGKVAQIIVRTLSQRSGVPAGPGEQCFVWIE